MQGKRLLIVEDEPALRITLAANLELEGFEILEAETAERALEIIAGHELDLVLSDIRMPGLSGVELHREIKRTRPDLPVVLMTAFTADDHIDEATQAGVFTVLSKPFEIDDVIPTLVRALQRPTVLIVDGELVDAEAAAAALSEKGVRAQAAASCTAAVEMLQQWVVDVCVANLLLADARGGELVGKLGREAPEVMVIAVAEGRPHELIHQAAAEGAFAFLAKPLDPRQLVRTIAQARRTLPRPRSRSSAPPQAGG
jgi:DNA-binding NtrC family response regulator